MDPLSSMLSCLCGSDDDYHWHKNSAGSAQPFISSAELKRALSAPRAPPPKRTGERFTAAEKAVADVLSILRAAENDTSAELPQQVDDIVTAQGGWTEWIAEGILNGIKAVLEQGDPDKIGSAMKSAYDRSVDAAGTAFQFAEDHPVAAAGLLTIVAVGVLVLLAPVVVEALGFAELGPVEGSFAAWWESTYAGYIPKGSLFSFFQRLGMLWGRA
ncbi:uncharacterized protein B0I36DRAFT_162013 [Microdochium trichocladiopsis]|uniref:Uncharacterized protein n=1 Tax=Microdochium trichocladiopsis TaxID=1682393 RepID=A0A9P9BL04_9PEZI|nr:uncharacterized protein B0I36DRAFT_162013 [Microdochium trichocladiopsis]KAH7024399.1 hypothetical protein B0I36DRAFT_162013 [Microdochium trichocladiopsis]